MVTIGTVGEQTGLVGAFLAGGIKAVQVWVSYMNASGGLNCHPLKYIVADDGADPSRNQSLVQQLVEQDHILAFVYMDDALDGQASVPYITQHQIPVVGTDSADPWDYTSPMFFPQASSSNDAFRDSFASAAAVGLPQGKSKIASASCIEAPLCSAAYGLAPTYAPEFGMTLVYRAQVSIAQPDYTSTCQSAHNAGAQIFFLGLDGNSIQRLARSCASVNYHPLLAATAVAVLFSEAADPNLEGMLVGQNALPWLVTSNPANQQFLAALKQYAPGLQPNPSATLGWLSGKVLELAGQHLSDPPTSQSILQGLWSIKGNDFGGMTAPLTYHLNANNPQPFCYWTTQVHNGQWTVLNGGARTCV